MKHLSVFGHEARASPAVGNSQGFNREIDGLSWAPSMSWGPAGHCQQYFKYFKTKLCWTMWWLKWWKWSRQEHRAVPFPHWWSLSLPTHPHCAEHGLPVPGVPHFPRKRCFYASKLHQGMGRSAHQGWLPAAVPTPTPVVQHLAECPQQWCHGQLKAASQVNLCCSLVSA